MNNPLNYFRMKELILFAASLLMYSSGFSQNIGIGILNPQFPLSFNGNLGDKISLWTDWTSTHYGFGIQSGLFQMFSKTDLDGIAFGFGSSTSFNERMRIVNSGESGLQLYGRIELKNGTIPVNENYGPGIWLYNADNTSVLGFMGTQDNQNMGFYGGPLGWGFSYDAINSRVGIGNENPDYPLEVTGNSNVVASIVNTITIDGVGVNGACANTPGEGWGVAGYGGEVGVTGFADLMGSGSRRGIWGYGSNGTNNYGVYANAFLGTNTYGVYASGNSGTGSNWAGYFVGDVYTSGSYQASDRKLKSDIIHLIGALSIINQLNPSVYIYKTNEYQQMHLPDGLHYGLMADEVEKVVPGAVKKAIQPAQFENHDEQDGKKLTDEVEFNVVNYIEMIPILIAAVKEQQVLIEALTVKAQKIDRQQQEIDELRKLVEELLAKK